MYGCVAKIKYFKGKYLNYSTLLYVGTSSHCYIDHFFHLSVVVEKGTGDIASMTGAVTH